MDEQAGPGVFFSNNHPGAGGAKGLGPLAEAAAAGDGAAAAGAARAQYSLPGILHFLQHEWARFEVERAQWEVERAELQAQIAFLQGERKGQENLKKDLVRRIKMLEYALKQERAKYHKLKYGTELNQGDMKPPSYDSDEGNETEVQPQQNSQLMWKQGRQLLRQYLQEVGYTDTILDVKSKRVRALLGFSSDVTDREDDKNQDSVVNGTEAEVKETAMIAKSELTDSASVLDNFKFLESAAADFSDEDEDDDVDGREKSVIDASTIVRKKALPDSGEDRDTKEALKEFDFLVTSEEGDNESRSAGDGTDWEKEDQCLMPEAWNVDQGVITKLKEQYKKERKGKKGVKRPNRSKLQDMLANLRDVDELPSLQPSVGSPSRPSSSRLPEHEINRADEVEALTFPPSSGKSFIMGADEALESELGLGELAGLTVANEADSLTYDIANNKDALRKTWNPKFTLRSHFDGIRALAFHPIEPVLITASEDHTLKMWNLQKTAPAKKSTSLDVEPIYTFRAHLGIPASVDLVSSDPSHMVASFSKGYTSIFNMETQQRILTLESNVDTTANSSCQINRVISHPTLPISITAHEDRHIKFYDNNTGKLIHSMVAHLEAVTSLAVDPNGLYLMSGSHDCSIRLWNLESKTCIQEFTAHRKKFEESIHDVAFHPSKCYIASAGADALAKVFV
uniref:Cell cycle autoantigen SG2NA n=1 Tax=Gorilla gorilla gorilla TaxID=9595 RepID=G3QDE1_GORGO